MAKYPNAIKNTHGLSAMSMVVGLAFLGILTAGTAAVIEQIISTQATDRFRTGAQTLTVDVANNLGSKPACLSTFTPAPILDNSTNATFPAIKNATGTNVAVLGPQPWDSHVRLGSIRLDNYDPVNSRARLTLNFDFGGKMAGGSTLTRTIELSVRRDEVTHSLVECRALAVADANFWRPLAGTQDMSFSGGRIGIGTSSPVAALDVAGEVRFGNSNAACNAQSEGQQRYNSTAKRMEFCNGTAWTTY